MSKIKQNQRISNSKKNANKKAWYKDQADMLDTESIDNYYTYGNISEKKKMKVNYDLFNNILNLSDFEYVCKPFGAEAGELPAKMVNRDIISGKIKAMLGMEMKRPFSWRVIATNPEATTRKEQEEFGRIKKYVINEIMFPIREEIELKYQQQLKNRELTEEEKAQIQQQIASETKSQTPIEVKKYMEREYQDPVEVMCHQLLEYLIQKCDLKRKFNTAFKHGLLSGREVMYIGILNGEPETWNVNSLNFNYDKSPDIEFVEDSEWATCEYKMTPSEIIKYFGDELSQDDIDLIYESWPGNKTRFEDINFFEVTDEYNDNSSIKVLHCVWKSLRKIGFLYYKDDNEEIQMMLVDENYILNEENNDIKIEWEWIPEVYETWKIKLGKSIYVNMRPIPGQFKDLDNLYNCKLPYYGAIYDNMNSQETSIMDRLVVYQYYYNIVMFRLELLIASDKGKKVLMNINSVPDSSGFDIEKWSYFFESTPYMWFDTNENKDNYADANTVAKVVDLSLVSDIKKYIEIAEYLRQQAGRSVGITEQIEGQIGANEAVRNAQQAITQSSHILELYFELHNHVKKNVLQALLEVAKIAYSQSKKEKLNYVLDDMSRKTIDLDIGLLDNSTLGLFVSNSAKAEETKELIRQLAHAALQNQKIELSDVISVLRQNGIVEAEETLKVAEKQKRDFEMSKQQQMIDAQAEESKRVAQREEQQHKFNIEEIIIKEEERRKTEIIKSSLLASSFNPDQDKDKDGVNDFVELAKQYGLEADIDIKRKKEQLEREKFKHQQQMDKEKIRQTDEKLKIDKGKK